MLEHTGYLVVGGDVPTVLAMDDCMSLPEKTLRFSNRGAPAGLDDVTFDGRSSVPWHVTCTVEITEAATYDADVTFTAIDTYALTCRARGQFDVTYAAQPVHTMRHRVQRPRDEPRRERGRHLLQVRRGRRPTTPSATRRVLALALRGY